MSDIASKLRIENRRLKEEHLECARLATILNDSLRARVEVLERALHGIAEFCDKGEKRTFTAIANTARAALKEATP